jgi:hypothetical protein
MRTKDLLKSAVVILVALSIQTTVEAKGKRILAQNAADDELNLDLESEDAAAQPKGAQPTDDLGVDELEADIPAENAPAPDVPPETPAGF